MSYFELIKDPNILKDYNFWRNKLIKEYGIPDYELNGYQNHQFLAQYQALLSDDLINIMEYFYTDKYRRLAMLYGNDIDDLVEKSSILRKEANKSFPMEYEKKLYKKRITSDDEFNYVNNSYNIPENIKPENLFMLYREGLPAKFCYCYQMGIGIEYLWSTHPNLPIKLFEDNTIKEIEEIYDIKLDRNKL